jgi:ADP-ribosylglycohydrolase
MQIQQELAGAFYGEKGIPTRWLSKLAYREKIIEMADNIYRLSKEPEEQKQETN